LLAISGAIVRLLTISGATVRLLAISGAIAFVLASCGGDHVSRTAGLDEPIRVEGAQFIEGTLPGLPEPAAGVDGGPAAKPLVSDAQPTTNAIAPGTEGLDFLGHTSPDAQTVAVRFADLGTGYWVVPVQGPDPSANGFLTWAFTADFAHDLAPGPHTLVLAAIGAGGASGTQFTFPFCVDTPVPDNFNACSPKRAPPSAVLSLSWDAAVDVDLVVRTPAGVVVGGKSVTTAPPGSSVSAASGGGNGVLDHDSNRNCAIDGIDREDIVWQTAPMAGTYSVWVDLAGACGKPAVRFEVALWIPQPDADGGTRLVQQPALATGELLASQTNAGSSPGLYVGSFNFE
jgi:hypothetical protein